ncbi:hypothetical protein ACSHWG_00855 [Leucobacter sp. Z1108]|uniref:hypothetical protein n=1 Tax=Leucobacter sp. Z1108 TaxID=3439066 RepID=UPI003F2E41DB
MLSEAGIPGTDDWLLVKLATELGNGFPRLYMLDTYRDGTFVVPIEADPAVREAYKKFANRARLTFADTIVTQTTGRLNPRGFRTAAANDANGDREAARIMRMNHMEVQFRDMLDAKTHYGKAFGIVGLDDMREPFATVRDPWSVAVQMNAIRPWLVDAAVVATHDPVLELDMLTLFRPGTMRVAVKPAKQTTIPTDGTVWNPTRNWDWAGGPVALGFTERVPVVKLENPRGIGEFENHIDSIDRVTEDILQRLTITAMQAFRQRAITPDPENPMPEYYPEGHAKAGEKIDYDEIYKGGPAALWYLPAGAKIWESQPTEIQSLIMAEAKDLEHLAAVTGTPLYSLSPDANQSAEGAKLARETIRTKVSTRQARDGDPFTEFMSIMFEAHGDTVRADRTELTMIWGPQEAVSKADRAEAARAALQAGRSQRFISEHIFELTPDEMALEEANLRDEQFQASLMGVTSGANNGNGGTSLRPATVASGATDPGAAGVVE